MVTVFVAFEKKILPYIDIKTFPFFPPKSIIV